MEIEELISPTTNDNTVETQFHTLYWENVKDGVEMKSAIIDGEETFIGVPVAPHNDYTLYLSDFMNKNTDTHKLIHKLRSAVDGDTINIIITSDGGSVTEGIELMNTIKEVFPNITTTVNASAYSMGMLMFTIGEERVMYQDSSVMAHNVSLGLGGSGNQVYDYLDFELKQFDRLFKNNVVNKDYMTVEEYEIMKIGKEQWWDAVECAKRGLATHIIVGGFKLDSEAYMEFSEQDKPIDEWAVTKMEDMIKDLEEPKPVLNKDGSVRKKMGRPKKDK